MATSNLVLLDRAVQGAVALELGDGDHDKVALAELGVVPKRTRNVAGLKIVSNAARDAAVDPKAATMIDKLLRYRADHDLVIDKLKRVGIEPLAVLPSAAWEKILDGAGLYRFKPDGDKVRVSAAHLLKRASEYAEACATEKHFIHSLVAWGVYLAVEVALFGLGKSGWGGLFYFLFGIGIFPLGLLLAVATGNKPADSRPQKIEAARIRELVDQHEKEGTLVKELWPDLKEPSEGAVIRIALPEPPLEVQERLVIAERARLPLNVAVVGDAIMFKEPVADVLVGVRQKYWEEVDRLVTLNRNPIAYVIEGTAVAIIDQYGDFPIEKEVMSEVINLEHLV